MPNFAGRTPPYAAKCGHIFSKNFHPLIEHHFFSLEMLRSLPVGVLWRQSLTRSDAELLSFSGAFDFHTEFRLDLLVATC